ncbi:hypothetical protein O3P69_009383 [Scylla paramamosain]|uniref:Fasciculation and elongation protein zeta-2 n=1 Tax=Scylla paramamosain TaxID=85552 RepID=A0AAW0STI3_SCYPA
MHAPSRATRRRTVARPSSGRTASPRRPTRIRGTLRRPRPHLPRPHLHLHHPHLRHPNPRLHLPRLWLPLPNVTPLSYPPPSPQPFPPAAVQTGPSPSPLPSPASQPGQAPPTPTSGPESRQEAKAQPPPQTCSRPVGLQAAPAPSREAVLRGVRARVGEASRGGGVDADKDVCEAAAEEEEEFYRVRVRTRLVSYDNSTLVIRNTSRGDAAPPDPAPLPCRDPEPQPQPATTLPEAHEDHQPPAGPHPPAQPDPSPPVQASPSHHTPPTPLVSQPAMVAAPPAVVNVSPVHARATSAQLHAHAGAVAGAVAGAGAGVKRRLTLLVNRGRNFLAEVYSATQSRLDHYRAEGAPRPGPPRYSHATPPPLEVEVNPMWLLQHTPQAQWLPTQWEEGAGVPAMPLHTPEGGAGGAGAVLVETPVNGEAQQDAAAGVQVVVDEEWIKKNILCTCKCRPPPATRSEEELVEEEEQKKPEEQDAETEEHSRDDESEQAERHGERDKGAPLPHLPTEIQELLDADHARMWWTITGNFGNILPIDWSKTYTRQQYLPVLNLNEMKEGSGGGAEEGEGGTERSAGDDGAGEEEEEEVAQDLDLHHLILNGLTAEPVKSAEEVIQEIDDIMQEGSSSEDECVESSSSGENMQDIPTRPCPPHLYHDKLKSMSVPELNEALMELELVIRRYSETLITQLALRDELEYEKELKNSFISLLLQVQNKRRNFNIEKKKQKKVGPNGTDPKYLTTVIPYDVGHGPPQNPTLQILIKILTAINEDSPTVPTLLTDYILKVLCPS